MDWLPKKPSISSLIPIHLHISHVYTPTLPDELWLLIFKFAATEDDTDGFCPYVYTRSKYAHNPLYYDSSQPTHSFLDHTPAHTHLPERLARYKARLRWISSLTLVCRLFNLIAQEVLFQEIWISSSKDGRRMAAKLGGVSAEPMGVVSTVTTRRQTTKSKPWWRSVQVKTTTSPVVPIQQRTITHRQSSTFTSTSSSSANPGRFIRHLRIETPPLDKCSPHDILLILQHCPLLSTFQDFRSIRRPMHPLGLTTSEVVPFSSSSPSSSSSSSTPHPNTLTTDALSHTILSRPLRRLTWTNYSNGHSHTNDFEPLLSKIGHNLDVLELISCGGAHGDLGSSVGFHGGLAGKHQHISTLNLAHSLSSLCTSTTEPLSLPSLASLKATLDNATFHILASWDMPALLNLSVISAQGDFGFSSPALVEGMGASSPSGGVEASDGAKPSGFRTFLEVHGHKIRQLELGSGCTNGEVDGFWVTERGTQRSVHQTAQSVPLSDLTPNLLQFICTADAQWNWLSPDWIAPHVLLPSHHSVEFIGVRGLERRVVNDLEDALARRGRGAYYASGNAGAGGEEDMDDPYFSLLQQFSSLLRVEAFPNLRYIRDMSWESDVIRRTGRVWVGDGSSTSSGGSRSRSSSGSGSALGSTSPTSSSSSSPSPTFSPTRRFFKSSYSQPSSSSSPSSHASTKLPLDAPSLPQPSPHGIFALRYWMRVLTKCRERGVWLEDWRGVNVTMGELRRVVGSEGL